MDIHSTFSLIAQSEHVSQGIIDNIKAFPLSDTLNDSLCKLFELLDSFKNKNWIVIIYITFTKYYDKLYIYWSEILELIKSIEIDVLTAKVCLEESFNQSSTSWIASAIVESAVKGNLMIREEISQYFNNDFGIQRLNDIIDDNSDITTSINLIKALSCLGLLNQSNSIEYIINRNPTFKNVFQMLSISSLDSSQLNLKFSNNNIILVQIVKNTMIIWNCDKYYYAINLSNLYNYTEKSLRTISLTFKKLSRFDTIDYKLNSFSLVLSLKKNRLFPFFVNKVKNSRAIKFSRAFINIPLLISPEKVLSLDKCSLSLENASQNVMESPEKIVLSKKTVKVNSSQKIVANIQEFKQICNENKGFDLTTSSLSDFFEDQQDNDNEVQVPATQNLLEVFESGQKGLNEQMPNKDTSKTQKEASIVNDMTEGRRTRSGRLIRLEQVDRPIRVEQKRKLTDIESVTNKHKKPKFFDNCNLPQRYCSFDKISPNETQASRFESIDTPPIDEGTLRQSSSISEGRFLGSQIKPVNLSASRIHADKFEAINTNLTDITKSIVQHMAEVEDQIIDRFNDLNEELEDGFQKIINQYGERIEQLNEYINLRKSGLFIQNKP